MRFHVLGLPHTVTDSSYSACAFTQKVLKFCKMMHQRGHTIIHYGHERSKVECTEHVSITNDEVLTKAYGDHNWHKKLFKHDTSDAAHTHFNMRAAEEITKRKQPGDFLLLFWGIGHAHVARVHFRDMIVVEPGIGSYNNVCAPFSVFESYAVMHHVYAKYNLLPRFMDAVVPNYFDVTDFIDASNPESVDQNIDEFLKPYGGLEKRKPDHEDSVTLDTIMKIPKGQYAVMLSRMIPTKGVQLAIEACAKADVKLILTGQGEVSDAVTKEFLEKHPGTSVDNPKGYTHIGYIEPVERAVLLARAKFLFCPSLYAEPFAGVNVEGQITGLPIVCTDWGAFNETVIHGKTGYRCRVMDHFIWAMKNIDDLNRKTIREIAVQNYGFNKVGSMYEEYFQMLSREGYFYAENNGRLGLKWLEKKF